MQEEILNKILNVVTSMDQRLARIELRVETIEQRLLVLEEDIRELKNQNEMLKQRIITLEIRTELIENTALKMEVEHGDKLQILLETRNDISKFLYSNRADIVGLKHRLSIIESKLNMQPKMLG